MIVLVSGATATHRRYVHTGHFGYLVTPSGWHALEPIAASGLPWGADNDCFNGLNVPDFRRMLARITGLPGCKFISVPDVLGDAQATMARFDEWYGEVAVTGQPVALVGQDGAERLDLPWDRMGALFVGGGTDWKLSKAAMGLTEEAKRRGLYVHVGRVNSFKRIRRLWDWGTVDSIDGTSFSRWSDVYFPKFQKNIRRLKSQSTLFFPDTEETPC